MKIFRIILILLFTAMAIVGCSQSGRSSSDTKGKKLEIYTSLYPIQYVVEKIGGDTVTVRSVYPPGSDAHTYEPSSKEMVAIANSDAFFYLGAGMEAFSETIADSLATQDVNLIEIGKNKDMFIEDGHEHDHDNHGEVMHEEEENDHDTHNEEEHHHHGDYDPHIWLDPIKLIEITKIIKEELISLNPDDQETYEKNFTSLTEELTSLDNKFESVISKKKNKHILVSHAAYGYWEQRYGIEQIAVNGLSSSNEPSQKELTNVINLTKELQLNYILFEQNITNRVSEIIQDEVGAKSAVIHNLEVLTDKDIKNNEDYISLMETNLEVLDKAMD